MPNSPLKFLPLWNPGMSQSSLPSVQVHQLQSSLLTSVAYHATAGLLDVVLTNGYRYRYLGVPPQVYVGLLRADSKGRFFNAQIKNTFPYQRF
jgi:KTSC domain